MTNTSFCQTSGKHFVDDKLTQDAVPVVKDSNEDH